MTTLSAAQICIAALILTALATPPVHSQTTIVKMIDAETKQAVPYATTSNELHNEPMTSDPGGMLRLTPELEYEFSHPFYVSTKEFISAEDSMHIIALHRNPDITVNPAQLSDGDSIVRKYHEYLSVTGTMQQPEFEYISYFKFDIFQQAAKNSDEWVHHNSLESIEKNRFKFPDKRYSRIVSSQYSDGESNTREFIPITSNLLSPRTEYFDLVGQKFYNPLFNGASRRYDYALIETIRDKEDSVYVIIFKPRENKRFVGLTGLLYFSSDRYALIGGLFLPHRKKIQDFGISFYSQKTSRNTYFVRHLNVVLFLNDIPNLNRKTKVELSSRYTLPNFDVKNTTNKKWVDMAVFSNTKDSIDDDTWLMTQIVDDKKLEYIKKDTTNEGFVLSRTLKQLYNIYDGRMAYRLRFFDVNNVFAINKFEVVRIGIGLQSHENFSDVFTFGGYVGYGIGDGEFKYGGNVGMYFGPARRNLFSFKYTRDLLEPGLVYYMDKRQDLVRNFFTSRMDGYQSAQVSVKTRINAYLTSNILFNNYRLKPLYDYTYNPNNEEINEVQTFSFTETSLLLNVGTPFSDHPGFRDILYRKKHIRSNLFINLTKGWTSELGGEYDYVKVNGRLSTNIQIGKKDELNVILDGGVMTPNQPYQINYGGPGTEFKLTGIIINNAFQTMKLYGFFSDRYLHSFLNYDFGNIILKKSRFKPELALALNLGWGKLKGNSEIHQNIEVRDYPDGYFEGGILLNNLLRLKIYNYFYGGLGVGTFVAFGPDAENGAFAIRLSYSIGIL